MNVNIYCRVNTRFGKSSNTQPFFRVLSMIPRNFLATNVKSDILVHKSLLLKKVIESHFLRDHVKQNTWGVTHDPANSNLLREAPINVVYHSLMISSTVALVISILFVIASFFELKPEMKVNY